jgi:hypothetical protein
LDAKGFRIFGVQEVFVTFWIKGCRSEMAGRRVHCGSFFAPEPGTTSASIRTPPNHPHKKSPTSLDHHTITS